MTKEQIMEAIEQMTVLELSEMVKALEEKFGVSAAAPVAMAAAPVAAAATRLFLVLSFRRNLVALRPSPYASVYKTTLFYG